MQRGCLVWVLCACACGNGDDVYRVDFHEFPTGPGSSRAYNAVHAYPALRFDRLVGVAGSNDGTDRIFVARQDGVIEVFANAPDTTTASVFLDLRVTNEWLLPFRPVLEALVGYDEDSVDRRPSPKA